MGNYVDVCNLLLIGHCCVRHNTCGGSNILACCKVASIVLGVILYFILNYSRSIYIL